MPLSSSSSTDEEIHEHDLAQKEKTQKKRKFIHKYQTAWESHELFKRWVVPSKKGNTFFFCKFCSTDYSCGKSEILKHMKSKKHINNAAQFHRVQTLDQMVATSSKLTAVNKSRENEIRICSFLVEHNISFNVADHLVSLIKKLHLNKEVIVSTTCNRTKATNLVKNVIGTYGEDIICFLLRSNKFSLMIDESTDVSTTKHLALIARLCIDFKIRDEFLAIIEIADATAINIYNVIVNYFKEKNIPYKENLVGFAADGASVMMGATNSVSQLLKKDIPDLFILNCVCHSFALCGSYACQKLPSEIEILAKDIYSYMKNSYKRTEQFKEFQTFVELKPLKMLHPSQTRWLSLITVVDRILNQYSALKLYFRSELTEKNNKGAQKIYEYLNNDITKLYFQFLSYSLSLFTNLNKDFQSESPKIHTLYSKVLQVYRTLLDNYMNQNYLNSTPIEEVQFRNPHNFLKLEDMYFGHLVSVALANAHNLSPSDIINFKKTCLDYYIESAHQIYKRFPFNGASVKILKEINVIDPKYLKEQKPISIAPLATHFTNFILDLQTIDNEWRLLRNDIVIEESDETNVTLFWTKIKNCLNMDGTQKYAQLSKLVEIVLTLPHSSASTERLFSAINLNKTKTRNKLSTDTLKSILYTKSVIGNNNCYDFPIADKLLHKGM